MREIVSVNGVTKTFRGHIAVDNASFSVEEGDFVGIVGPNGSGKTTLFKMMCGLLAPTEGSIIIDGVDAVSDYASALERVGCVIGTQEPYRDVTPNNLLKYVGRLFRMPEEEIESRIDSVLAETGMTEWKDRRIGKFSKGMKQRIILAQALMNRPKVLILDEPMSGLDPRGMYDLSSILKGLNSTGTTILLSSHNLHVVTRLCNRIVILNHGAVVKDGRPNDFNAEKGTGILIKTSGSVKEEDLKKVLALPDTISASITADGLIIYTKATGNELLTQVISLGIEVSGMESADPLEEVFMDITKGD